VKLAEFARRIAVCQRYVRGFVARRKYEHQLQAAKEEYEKQMIAFSSLLQNANDLAVKSQNESKSEDAEIQQKKEEERRKETERKNEEERRKEAERKEKEEQRKEAGKKVLLLHCCIYYSVWVKIHMQNMLLLYFNV